MVLYSQPILLSVDALLTSLEVTLSSSKVFSLVLDNGFKFQGTSVCLFFSLK